MRFGGYCFVVAVVLTGCAAEHTVVETRQRTVRGTASSVGGDTGAGAVGTVDVSAPDAAVASNEPSPELVGGAGGSSAGIPTPVTAAGGLPNLPLANVEPMATECEGVGPTEACLDQATCLGACASLPEAWSGPIALFVGDPLQVPACASDYDDEAFTLFGGLQAPSSVCPTCECQADPSASCDESAWLELHGNGECSDFITDFDGDPWVADGFCYSFSGGGVQSLLASFDLIGDDACLPLEIGSPGIPAFGWTQVARGCILTSCPDAQGCTAAPSAPYQAALCVYREGEELDCPVAYPERRVFYAAATDTRGCSACSCGPAACNATFDVYTDSFCSQGRVRIAGEGPLCQPFVPPNNNMSATYLGGSAECAPVAPVPTGAVDPAQPVSVCCQAPP